MRVSIVQRVISVLFDKLPGKRKESDLKNKKRVYTNLVLRVEKNKRFMISRRTIYELISLIVILFPSFHFISCSIRRIIERQRYHNILLYRSIAVGMICAFNVSTRILRCLCLVKI